jgi:uncharacterized protein involved in outer membrane biogenesis
MRKLAVAVVAVCVVAVVAVILLPQFLDVNHYRPRIQEGLQGRLGRPVSLGTIKASFLPPSLVVKDVVIGEDPRFGAGPFAKVQQLDVRVALFPLLRGDLQVKSLRLVDPDIELIKDQGGQWNYASLGQPQVSPQPPGGGVVRPGEKPTAAPQLSLDHLQIVNGRLRLIDRQNNARSMYDDIDATLDNFAPGRPFQADATVHIAGRGDQQIRLRGTAGPMPADGAMIPFDGTVDLQQISLRNLEQVIKIGALEGCSGVASGSLKVQSGKGFLRTEGSLKVEDPQVEAVKLGYPVMTDFRLDYDPYHGAIRIDHAELKLGQAPVSLAGTIQTTATPAQLDIRVGVREAPLPEVARLAAAAGFGFNSGTSIKGILDADISAHGAAHNLALRGHLKATGVELTGGQVRQPVSVPQLDVALTPTALSSSPFVAKTGGTQLNAQFAVKDYTSESPSVSASIRTDDANVGDLLVMAGAYGVPAFEGISGTGLISLNVKAAGPLKNVSEMAFSGNGTLRNVSLNTPSLTKPLNLRTANIRFSRNSVAFENLQASLDQSNASGSLSVHDFANPVVQFALNIDKLDLAAMQQIIATPGAPVKKAQAHLIPPAYAQQATSKPSLITRVAGNGTIDVGTLTYDQIVMNSVKANVTLDHGIIRLSPQTSGLYGGKQAGEVVMDTRVAPAEITVATKLQGVDANRLVSAVSSIKNTLYGSLAGDTNVRFRAASGAAFAHSLNGKLDLDLSNGRIANVALLNELATIGRFLNSSVIPRQSSTEVTRLTGTFDVVNGVAQTNDLRAVIDGASLAANGTVNLATTALNLHLTVVMAKEISQKVGGNRIGGFMQTALANSKGELVIPVIVTGTFESPHFAPDAEEIARMRLKNLLPGLGNPGSMTSGILDAVLGGSRKGGQQRPAVGNQQQNQQQVQPADALGDLLRSVMEGKKKKKQEPPPSPPPR